MGVVKGPRIAVDEYMRQHAPRLVPEVGYDVDAVCNVFIADSRLRVEAEGCVCAWPGGRRT